VVGKYKGFRGLALDTAVCRRRPRSGKTAFPAHMTKGWNRYHDQVRCQRLTRLALPSIIMSPARLLSLVISSTTLPEMMVGFSRVPAS